MTLMKKRPYRIKELGKRILSKTKYYSPYSLNILSPYVNHFL